MFGSIIAIGLADSLADNSKNLAVYAGHYEYLPTWERENIDRYLVYNRLSTWIVLSDR